jgi:hypothetical protein
MELLLDVVSDGLTGAPEEDVLHLTGDVAARTPQGVQEGVVSGAGDRGQGVGQPVLLLGRVLVLERRGVGHTVGVAARLSFVKSRLARYYSSLPSLNFSFFSFLFFLLFFLLFFYSFNKRW